MAEKILMPKLSDTMEEGVIASWQVKVGDTIASDTIIAEIESDKSTMEQEAYIEGTVLYLVEEGATVPVDGLIAIVGDEGENIDGLIDDNKGSSTEDIDKKSKEQKTEDKDEKTEKNTDTDKKIDNAKVIQMPKLSDTMEEGVIASWQVKVGDKVSTDTVIAEIESDKATMEQEAYEEGTVLYLVDEGSAVSVDGLIAVIGEEGADYETLIKQFENKNSGKETKEKTEPESKTETQDTSPEKESPKSSSEKQSSTTDNGRIKISPLARKLAEEKNFDIAEIEGTGDGGRIIKRDVENFTPSAKSKTQAIPSSSVAVGEESFEDKPLSQMRKTIAKRLGESKFTAPHFYLTMEINMDEAMKARKQMNEISPVKISFNDLVVKACAIALKKHPAVNADWLEDKIRYNKHVHVGVAVAVDEGLLVPVVRFTDTKPLSAIASEVKELAGKARDKKLQPQDWEGNTFSISNLGMFGIEEFTAIINPPNACIMAVGTIKQVVVPKGDSFAATSVMKVTLSCDHRIVDGATGAAFLQTVKQLIESPVSMLV